MGKEFNCEALLFIDKLNFDYRQYREAMLKRKY